MIYEYKNPECSIITQISDTGHVVILEPGLPGWAEAVAAGPAAFAPPQVQPSDARAAALSRVLSGLTALEDAVTGGVPLSERLSWSIKEAAARNHVAGNPTAWDTALLTAEAALTGETLDALADAVIWKADRYIALVGAMAGIRRSAEAAIAAADTLEAIEAAADAALATIAAMG